MSQEGQEFVCNGAPCRCDKGTTPSPLPVTSQQFVTLQGKLQATTLDKAFVPFGSCALKNNQPCVPELLRWEKAFEVSTVQVKGCHPLLDQSTIRCAVGGVVSILNTLQIKVPGPPPAVQRSESYAAASLLAPILLIPLPPKTDASDANHI